jgi:hypothetical protein
MNESVKQISIRAMDFYPVEAGFYCVLGGFSELLNGLGDGG